MSLPLTASWEYDQKPAPGSPEADLLDACQNPRTWGEGFMKRARPAL